MDLIDLEKLRGMPIFEVLKEYCRVNKTDIQDIDALENYYNVIRRLEQCLGEADLRSAGPLIVLGYTLLRIESEKILLKYMDEDEGIRFIYERSSLYRVTIDMAVQDAVLSLLERHKTKIVVDPGQDGFSADEFLGLDMGGLNRRRETTLEDVQKILDDDDAYRRALARRMESAHLQAEAIGSSMVQDFDMDILMDRLREELTGKEQAELRDINMDYLDAFMASLHLSTKGEINVEQESFGAPIYIRPI